MDIPKKPGVYLLTNKMNGKMYVGETINLKNRHHGHKFSKNKKEVISKAIQKYGFENFEFNILKIISHPNKIVLWIYENHYINKFNTISNGYNVKYWGSATKRTTKDRIRISKKSLEVREKYIPIIDSFSPKRTGRKIEQINPITDEVIKVWNSIKEASIALNGRKCSHISEVCSGKCNNGYSRDIALGYK